MEIVTSWMEEGLERGRIEGRQQGLEEGKRQEALALVLRQLARRVGEIEPPLQERIQELPLTQIEELGEALLDFSSQSDLQGWLSDSEALLLTADRGLMPASDGDREAIQNTPESPASDDE